MLFAGLGNPEPRYQHNRHNLGFHALEALALALGNAIGAWGRKFNGELAQGAIGGTKVFLLKPETFMNRSGDSVAPALRFFKLEPASLWVVHDELDLDLGRIQLKQGGGTGGHNGLRSIEASLGSREFGRLRLGIGRPPAGWDPADYVLSDFQKSEVEAVKAEVQSAVAAMRAIVAEGAKKAMNEHNRQKKL